MSEKVKIQISKKLLKQIENEIEGEDLNSKLLKCILNGYDSLSHMPQEES